MPDFTALRQTMVDTQIMTVNVTNARVLQAFRTVPREIFLPQELRHFAYIDRHLKLPDTKPARYLLAPAPLARLVQLAEVRSSDKVLDIGCATGYSTVILAGLAGEVIALESDAGLAKQAETNLKSLNSTNVRVVSGPLNEGYAAEKPYDVIVFEGLVQLLPSCFADQLKTNGRLVAVTGTAQNARASIFVKTPESFSGRPVFDAALPLLPGFEAKETFAFAI